MVQFKPLLDITGEQIKLLSKALEINLSYDDELAYKKKKYFVIDMGDEIVGLCVYEFITNTLAHIESIFIKPNERHTKLGDGLLRSVLNSIELHGGTEVVFTGKNEELSFYKHVCATLVDISSDLLSGSTKAKTVQFHNIPGVYLESIELFFQKPCKGHRNR